jgi:methylenetetrahydrofolate dehydrogenase (NADP+) / methenyltetrahydrofolate cyclohydrolase
MKIDGVIIAQEILDSLKNKIAENKTTPHLAIIIVGDDPASKAYVRQKVLKAEEIGIKTTLVALDSGIEEEELLTEIKKLNNDDSITGIIVQKPLPKQIRNEIVNETINPSKDIDGFNPAAKFTPPISLSVLEIFIRIYKNLDHIKNKIIVILGKGETGGKPIKETLEKIGCNVILIDSKTKNSNEILKTANIVISAVGKKEIVNPQDLQEDVVLIGVGQHEENGKFFGDYSEESIQSIASFYTPTPGGIGPINVAMLLKNLVEA